MIPGEIELLRCRSNRAWLVRALELVELVDLVGQASGAGEETKDGR